MTADTVNGIPKMGLGSFGRTGEDGLRALLDAIEVGYRHIDTAQSYGTEENVGRAIARSGLPRDDIFITTKVADTNLEKADFLPSVEQSLETLGVDHIDLLLVHWPSANDAVAFEDYLLALAQAQQNGWARRIGVSNFTIAHLEQAEGILGRNALSTNQVEIHPYLQIPTLRDHARRSGLPLTAYMPLAKARVSDDAVLERIAQRHGVTAPAIALAFLRQEGHIVIPASSNRQRLKENFAAKQVTLNDEEMAAVGALDRGQRLIDPEKAPRWDD